MSSCLGVVSLLDVRRPNLSVMGGLSTEGVPVVDSTLLIEVGGVGVLDEFFAFRAKTVPAMAHSIDQARTRDVVLETPFVQ
jgi:hypothetical protein